MQKVYEKKRSYLCTPLKACVPYCTIPERLHILSEEYPDKEAIIFFGEKTRVGVTYKEIVDGAEEMARKMVKLGIKKNDVVAIHDEKSPTWLYHTFGAQMCGAWPLHFCFKRNDGSDVAALLKSSNCKAVITQAGDGDEYVRIMKNFVRFSENGIVQSETVPSLNHVFFVRKPDNFKNAATFDDLHLCEGKDLPNVEPEDIAAIFCSSGTTGAPKLIPWKHCTLITTDDSTATKINYGEPIYSDRTFGWWGGYPREMFNGVSRVTNTDMFKEKSIKEMCITTVRIINQEKCDHVVVFASIVNELLRGNYMMRQVKTIISAGGPVSSKDSEIVGRLCQKFMNLYASTENGVISLNIISPGEKMDNYDTGSPLPGVEVKVVDEDGRLSEVGTVGEVYVRSKCCSTGYLHEEQGWHKENRVEGYWFKTGDAGYVSENGHLFVAGRTSESIVIDGAALSPSLFEDTLKKHPCVDDVVGFGVPDEVYYEVVGVAVTLKEGKSASMEELLSFYRNERDLNIDGSYYASKYLPKHILFFDAFPMTVSGKIARKSVKEIALNRIALKN